MLRIYLKPLKKGITKKNWLRDFLDRRFKYSVARAGLKSIRESQRKTSDKGARIRKGVTYTIGRNSISFFLNSIGYYHNYGVRKHKMKYLLKPGEKMKVIPIQEKGQRVRFRTLTQRSMKKRGTWTHPGYKGKFFLEDGLKRMKNTMRKRLEMHLRKYLSGR